MGLTGKNFYKKRGTFTTSWDDGGKDDLKIAELLKKYKLPGTFYIVVDWIGTKGFLTWDDVKELDKQGFEVGSHTVTHPSDLKKLHEEQLHYEVQNSKDMIENVLGHNIKSFAYPRGRTNSRVKEYVAEAGYIKARGTGKPGVTEIKDKFEIPGTIHIFQRPEYKGKPILDFAKETVDRVIKGDGYCNIWGHSKEISRDKNWQVLEDVLRYIKEVKR